jgi:rRNA maturation RNase YbeY
LEINFFFESNILLHIDIKRMKKRFEQIAFFEGYKIETINFIFVCDRTILLINNKYLKHNFPTDVITFDYSSRKSISGDIYVSLDSIKFNARNFAVSRGQEINRVLIHGLLHLLGYKDKSSFESRIMRSREDYYLRLF